MYTFALACSLLLACLPSKGTTPDDDDADDTSAASDDTGSDDCSSDEVCDGIDNDCDGLIDDDDDDVTDASTWYDDSDQDGHGVDGETTMACNQPPSTAAVGGDCDDNDPSVSPGADEVCDDIDNDCGDLVDGQDDSVSGAGTWYVDDDDDGYGLDSDTTVACNQPGGTASQGGDCDDDDPDLSPAADEVCNGIDDDCDGLVDGQDDSVIGATTWYADDDGDGFGDPDSSAVTCVRPNDYVDDDSDCDDTDPAAGGGAEICDDIDNDCDGLTDGSDPSVTGSTTWYADADSDGYGDPDDSTDACSRPRGYVADDSDCDDDDSSAGGPEVCDDADNDCDGLVDGQDDSLEGGDVWYRDSDGDGYGNPAKTRFACSEYSGWVANASDCDDTDGDSGPCAVDDDGSICSSLMGSDDGEVPTFTGTCDSTSGFDSYDGHCYYAVSSSANWPTARASCIAAGGYLATIGDASENAYIQTLNSRPHIGGCDGDTEGTFAWITGEAFDYRSWASGEPNDMSGEDCLENAYTGGMWNDIWCSSNPYTNGYVCEFEL